VARRCGPKEVALSSRILAASVVALSLAVPAAAQEVAEPSTGTKFTVKSGDMSLLGVGLRVKKFAFVPFKVYALGFYVADSAIAGPLAAHKGKLDTPAFYKALIEGDFPKQMLLKFTRDVSKDRIQSAMREALEGADGPKTELFVSYFPEVKVGQECVLAWSPGGELKVTMAGEAKGAIPGFAATVFGIWLREKPIQDDIKKGLVARAPELIK
jgi:hypothetical protein